LRKNAKNPFKMLNETVSAAGKNSRYEKLDLNKTELSRPIIDK
jgi:hypothetical protein